MRILLLSLVIAFVFFSSCKRKDSCQMDHTGDICVTNDNNSRVDIYVDGTMVFSLDPNETKCVIRPVGVYEIRCTNGIQLIDYTRSVEECKRTEVTADFYD